jgi:hypothetical protein
MVESGQGKVQDILPKAEEPTPVCNTPNILSMNGQFKTQERRRGSAEL